MMRIKKEFGSYNSRRYGRPWGALVTFKRTRPAYNFDQARYMGDDSGGAVFIECDEGDIVAFGQKDHRGSQTRQQWYLVDGDGEIAEITPEEGYEYWFAHKS